MLFMFAKIRNHLPVWRESSILPLCGRRDVAQFGSAPALGAGCRRFESCRPDHTCGRSSSVEPQPSKLMRRVRLPSPAPETFTSPAPLRCRAFSYRKPTGAEPGCGCARDPLGVRFFSNGQNTLIVRNLNRMHRVSSAIALQNPAETPSLCGAISRRLVVEEGLRRKAVINGTYQRVKRRTIQPF